MSTEVRWRRGTATEHEAFTGAMSEITHDTTNNNLRVHDGQKPGGYATLMEDQVGVAGGVAPIGDDGLIPEKFLGDISVPDGSVTDEKLPDYSETVSPSSDKLRFQSSTSTGALAGAIQRPVNLKLSERLDAADFGVKADGVTNDTAAMVAALRAMEETGRPLFLPAGVIMANPDALFIGNGTETTGSTRNGQKIIGAGSSPANGTGTIIRARASGTCLFDIRGIIGGVHLSGVHFDCAGIVSQGFRTYSMSESTICDFSITNFTANGLSVLCRNGPAGSAGWSSGCYFSRFLITSDVVAPFGSGLRIDGTVANNYDPHRNTFQTGIVQVKKSASGGNTFAAEFSFCDSCTFIEVDFASTGTGNGFGVHLNSMVRTAFPQNMFMYGCSVTSWLTSEDGTHKIGKNRVINLPTMDGEQLPTHPYITGVTDTGTDLSDIVIDKDYASIVLKNRNGTQWFRIRNNSSNSSIGGLLVDKSADGVTWTQWFQLGTDGRASLFFPGVGFREITTGETGSGGAGFRQLLVAN